MDLESQLKAFGHAQVLVVLKPKRTKRVGARTALAVAETTAMQEEAASTLKPLFRRFADSRKQILAKETKRVATRRGGLEDGRYARAFGTASGHTLLFESRRHAGDGRQEVA
jgi:hypothetical protein